MRIVIILKMQISIILKMQIIVISRDANCFYSQDADYCHSQGANYCYSQDTNPVPHSGFQSLPGPSARGGGWHGIKWVTAVRPPPHPHSVAPLLRLPQRGDAVLAAPELSVCGQGPRGPAGVQSGNTNDDDVNLGWRCVGLSL